MGSPEVLLCDRGVDGVDLRPDHFPSERMWEGVNQSFDLAAGFGIRMSSVESVTQDSVSRSCGRGCNDTSVYMLINGA